MYGNKEELAQQLSAVMAERQLSMEAAQPGVRALQYPCSPTHTHHLMKVAMMLELAAAGAGRAARANHCKT
jgi:hypothetical protein